MYACVGTVFHSLGPTDSLVVAQAAGAYSLFVFSNRSIKQFKLRRFFLKNPTSMGEFFGGGLRVPTLQPMAGAWQGGADPCVKRSQRASGSRDNACGGDHLGVVACPISSRAIAGGPPRSDAHASASPDIKTGVCHKSFKTNTKFNYCVPNRAQNPVIKY
jgi:hypothetical protein